MDADRFDTFVRVLDTGSRRRVLGVLSAMTLGALGPLLSLPTVAGKKKKKKRKKKGGVTSLPPSPPPPGPTNPCHVTVLPGEDLQAAVDATPDGSTICLLGGTYDLSGPPSEVHDLLIDKFGLTVLGSGADQTILRGSGVLGKTVVVTRIADVRLSDLTITGGNGSSGGGVFNGDRLTMTNCTITGNAAAHGGGIFNGGSSDFTTLTLIGCTISGNTAFKDNKGGRGGGIWNGTNMSITDTTITNNQADTAGAIFNHSDGVITFGAGNDISGNTSTEGGPDCDGVTC